MIEIIELNQYDEIETFARSLGFQSFLQSEGWAKVKASSKLKIHGLLVQRDGVTIGATLLHQRMFPLNLSHFYAPRGCIVNLDNVQDVEDTLIAIKKFVKKKRGMFVTMDPEIVMNHLDDQGHPIPIRDVTAILEVFERQGFVHRGFNQNFEALNPRYTFILNLNQNVSLLDTYDATYRKLLRREVPYLVVSKTDERDFDAFVSLMEATAKREHFFSSGRGHYKHIYDTLHQRKMCDLYMVHLHVERLFMSLEYQKIELEAKKASVDPSKYKNVSKYTNRVAELDAQLNKVIQLIESYAHLDKGSIIPVSSIMTIRYADTVWTLHGGNHDNFKEFNAALHLYHKIFEDAKADGYHYADLFGTTGEWDNPDNPVYGIYLFKKRFQGDYVEYIGEFTYTSQRVFSFMYRKVLPVATKIIRKLKNS